MIKDRIRLVYVLFRYSLILINIMVSDLRRYVMNKLIKNYAWRNLDLVNRIRLLAIFILSGFLSIYLISNN
jgi:hypothetical protein